MAPEQIDSMTQRLVISPSKANKIDVRYEDIEKDKINNRLRESRELKRIEIATNKEAKSAPAETNIVPSQAKIDMAQVNIAKVKRTRKEYQVDPNLSPKTLRSTKNNK